MRLRWVALFALVAALLGATAWVVGRQVVSAPAHPRRATRAAFVSVRDAAAGVAVSYPSGWRRIASSDPQLVLLATGPGGASMLVRATPISARVNAQNLSAAKRLADHVVRSGKAVTMLRPPQQVTLGGLPGYLYLYTFQDPSSGERGAHAHYFLFRGDTMITIVFQAMPAARILALGPLFDRIASTFHVTG